MTTQPTTQPRPLHHAVKLTIDNTGGLDGDITCAAPVGAPCRLGCPAKGPDACESWSDSECRHGQLVDSGECQALDWFENDSVIDCYVGPDAEVRSGPVEIEWHGGGYSWTYPTTPDHAPAPVRDEREA